MGMTITTQCEGCGKTFGADPKYSGSKARCPKCGKLTAVPVDLPVATSDTEWTSARPAPVSLSERQLLEVIARRLGWVIVLLVVPPLLGLVAVLIWLVAAAVRRGDVARRGSRGAGCQPALRSTPYPPGRCGGSPATLAPVPGGLYHRQDAGPDRFGQGRPGGHHGGQIGG
jgi:hypothetical protein